MKTLKNLHFLLIVLLGFFFSSSLIAQDFITPIVNCVSYDEASGNYIAYFGYTNSHDEVVTIDNGKDNKLTPGRYKGQPTEFLPGTHNFVFQITFNGSDLTWHIDSDPFHVQVKSSTANSLFTSCSAVTSLVLDINENEPIPGVNVLAINAGIETTTDNEGLFSLSPVAEDDTIKFSLEGYIPLSVPVPDLGNTAILLQKIITGLDPIFSAPLISTGLEGDNLWPELYYLADQNALGAIVGSNDIFQIDSTDNTVLIEVWANQNTDMQELRSWLSSLGLRDEIIGGSNLLITGWYPIEALNSLNEDTNRINFVRPVFTPISNQGLATTQADSILKTNWVRAGYQLGGEGVKIGVLSDSYDANGSKAAAIVANGDLPGSEFSGNISAVEVLRDNPRGSNEGMGMMEIIHDIAPKATLGFRTGFLSPGDMANGIRELADANYDVIVDDITYLTEPFQATGQIAQSVSYAANRGVHYLSSAGNFGEKSHGGKFTPSANPLNFAYLPAENTYAHDFGGGDIFQQISLTEGTYIMELQWDDLFYSQNELPGSAYDLDVWVVDGLGNLLYSGNRHNTGEDPIEITAFRITEPSVVNIMITGSGIPAGLDFQYVIFKGAGWDFREYGANSSTIVGHASSNDLASVGAIFYGYTPHLTDDASLIKTNAYSSRGGNLMGNHINKPDFIAIDGTNTTSFGSDVLFDQDNFPNFFGSSAAAPHAAGVMAIMLEAYDKFYNNSETEIKNEISTASLREILAAYSLDLDESGKDNISGAGLIDAKAVLNSLANPCPQNLQLLVPEGVTPGKEQFSLSILGDYLTEESQLLLRGEALTITNRTSIDEKTTELTATVNTFIGNPPITLYSPSMPGTNGSDGGISDSAYFFTQQIQTITIAAVDTVKVFGTALPNFSFTTTPALPTEVMAMLPTIQFTTNANSLTGVGTYFITPSFETESNGDAAAIPVELQEIYEFEFVNAALIINPLAVTIKPQDQVMNYGDPLSTISFTYEIDNVDALVFPDSILHRLQVTHQEQLIQDTVAILNKGLAIVNKGLAIVNNSAWTISEAALNKGLAIVNSNPVVELDPAILEDYQNNPSGTLVNKGLAIVNSAELANGNALISLTDEEGNVISNKGLAIVNKGLAIVNKGLAIVNEVSGETAADKTAMVVSEEDDAIEEFHSINLITGLNAASESEPQYIIPGALFSENFLVKYEVGKLVINKASLAITASDTVINEYTPLPDFSSEVTGFLFGETYADVFGEQSAPSYMVNPIYTGAAGLYDIIPYIDEPANYSIEINNGTLLVNPSQSGSRIKVQLECHETLLNDPEGNTVKAYFSYENKNNTPWYIPEGEHNTLVGIGSYEGQLPTVFLPGRHIFTIEWDGTKMNWQLISNGRDKTNFASSDNANSQGCSISYEYLISETADYNYYPNPTKDFVNIEFKTGNVIDASVVIYNNQGTLINARINKESENNRAQVELANLPNDMYHIFINHLGTVTSIRIRKE